MKRTSLLVLAALLVAVNACRKQDLPAEALVKTAPDPTLLDEFIREKLLAEGQFLWSWASDEQIWTALANSDNVMAVGYQVAGEKDVQERLHQIDIKSPVWNQARLAVLQIILDSERELNPDLRASDLIAFPNEVLPVLDVRVKNPATISLLRQSPLVRYAEPLGYEPYRKTRAADRSGSGCDSNNPEPGLSSPADYTTIAPGCKSSWNYTYHNISQAWSNSTGTGAKVVIIDTGAGDDQDNLGEAFNQGYSSGRTIEKLVTLPQATNFWGNPVGDPETPHDQCGHGTSMQGACAAPRGTDGAATGVAYNCNLVSIRAAADVYLDESRESVGVANAFTTAGGNSTVRIISMSMGRLTSSSQITDAIKYAYNNGKLIFCAAGTSYWWTSWFVGVIYPATLAECVAVTGIKDNLTQRCSNCHSGSKVDFVVVMEKNSNGRTPLSLAMEGNAPSTVGGSSVSTATTAGIAALVWAKYPSWTRTQVFNRLKTSGSYYPSKNGSFGWGRVNAQLATQ